MADARPVPKSPGVTRTFHGTALVADYRAAVAWLGRMCGLSALEYSDAGPPIARRGGCCWIGDNLIELMEPNDPAAPGGRYLAKFGPSLYNLALQVSDLASACAWFEAQGAPPTVPPDVGFTFTRPSTTCGIQFEWADLQGDWDPRFGGAIPPVTEPLIATPRVAWWGAMLADPVVDAKRLQEVCGLPLLFMRPDAPDDQPVAALSLYDGIFALFRLPASAKTERALWGQAYCRPRLHATGLRVNDLAGAARVFESEHIGLLRGTPQSGELVTDPSDTVGLTFVWTDRDWPEDPRGPLPSA